MRKRMEDIGGTIEWINQEKGLKVIYALSLVKNQEPRAMKNGTGI